MREKQEVPAQDRQAICESFPDGLCQQLIEGISPDLLEKYSVTRRKGLLKNHGAPWWKPRYLRGRLALDLPQLYGIRDILPSNTGNEVSIDELS